MENDEIINDTQHKKTILISFDENILINLWDDVTTSVEESKKHQDEQERTLEIEGQEQEQEQEHKNHMRRPENQIFDSSPRERRERRERRESIYSYKNYNATLDLIDKNNERLCNYLWCILKLQRYLEGKQNYFFCNPIAIAASRILTETTANHRERYEQIISVIKKSIDIDSIPVISTESSTQHFIKEIISCFFENRQKVKIPKLETESEILWGFDYLKQRTPLIQETSIKPTSISEVKASITTLIDIEFLINKERCLDAFDKFNKAIQIRKLRNDDKISVSLPKKSVEQLSCLSKKHKKSKIKILEEIIQNEFNNMSSS